MHMVIIAWLYVAAMIAATESNIVGSLLSFSFYGLLPAAIVAYVGSPRIRSWLAERRQAAGKDHRPDA